MVDFIGRSGDVDSSLYISIFVFFRVDIGFVGEIM